MGFLHSKGILDNFEDIRGEFALRLEHWHKNWLDLWPLSKRDAIIKSVMEDPELANKVKLFIKREGAHSELTKARGIQMYFNLATQALFAPEFRALQDSLCHNFYRREVADGIRLTFACGMNPRQLGQWMSEVNQSITNPFWYERDGKAWDSTMQKMHMKLKRRVYRACGVSEEFLSFVAAGERVRGIGFVRGSPAGPFKYLLDNTVKSGHNDTTTGNTVINGWITVESLLRCGLKGEIIVVGDDLLVAIDGDFDLEALKSVEIALGIVPEARKFSHWWEVEFASGIWLETEDGFGFIPKPGRLLARLFWTCSPPGKKRLADFKHSIVCGLVPRVGNLPIIREFLAINDPGGKIVSTGKYQWTSDMEGSFKFVDPELQLCRRYGLTHRDILDACEFISTLENEPGLLVHPVTERMVEVDTSDILKRFS